MLRNDTKACWTANHGVGLEVMREFIHSEIQIDNGLMDN